MSLRERWNAAFQAMLADDPSGADPVAATLGIAIRIARGGPDNPVIAQVGTMAMDADSIVPHREFMPEPETDGFSILAFRPEGCAGQISLHLESDDAGQDRHVHLDAIFVDAGMRENGVAAILARAAARCVADVVRRAAAADPAAFDTFDPECRADTNAGGAAVLRILDHALQEEIDRIGAGLSDGPTR